MVNTDGASLGSGDSLADCRGAVVKRGGVKAAPMISMRVLEGEGSAPYIRIIISHPYSTMAFNDINTPSHSYSKSSRIHGALAKASQTSENLNH